jgi:hypothetical protein
MKIEMARQSCKEVATTVERSVGSKTSERLEYFAFQDVRPGWLIVFSLHGELVKRIGPTEDLPPDCLDFKNFITIRDDSGRKRHLYKVSVPLEIES